MNSTVKLKNFYCSLFFLASILNGQNLEGEIAPTFFLQDIEDKDYFFSQRDNSKPIYINFFATWCSPCLKELKEITEWEATHKNEIDILIIDVSSSARLAKPVTSLSIEELVEKYDIDSRVLIDKYAVVANKFNISSLPVNIFINKENVITKDIRKKIDASSFKKSLDLLKS